MTLLVIGSAAATGVVVLLILEWLWLRQNHRARLEEREARTIFEAFHGSELDRELDP